MKKTHGPSLRKEMRPLMHCGPCRGAGVVKGVFHQLDCNMCNASGWVCAETGEALPLAELVLQLNMKLRCANEQLARLRESSPSGPAQQYQQINRRGPGGSHYTGD